MLFLPHRETYKHTHTQVRLNGDDTGNYIRQKTMFHPHADDPTARVVVRHHLVDSSGPRLTRAIVLSSIYIHCSIIYTE